MWARLDDHFCMNAKVQRVWHEQPAAVGLYALALSWSALNDTDGHVDGLWVAATLHHLRNKAALTRSLVNAKLWVPVHASRSGWCIHDYLEYNPSGEEIAAKRAKDAERKRNASTLDSARTPHGIRLESVLIPPGLQASRPDPLKEPPLTPPRGGHQRVRGVWADKPRDNGRVGRQRDQQRWGEWLAAYCARRGWPEHLHRRFAEAVDQAIATGAATTDAQVDDILTTHFPGLLAEAGKDIPS